LRGGIKKKLKINCRGKLLLLWWGTPRNNALGHSGGIEKKRRGLLGCRRKGARIAEIVRSSHLRWIPERNSIFDSPSLVWVV